MLKLFMTALKGFGAFRFYCQPVMALIRGIRHGREDAAQHLSPLLTRLCTGQNKWATFKQASVGIRPVVILALILDIYAQLHLFDQIHFAMTALVIFIIVYCPYFFARDLTNRLPSRLKASPTEQSACL